MRTVWQVFLRDCRRILRNPVAVVVTLGVAMLPSLYAWFNILANWDPYSATGNLQVAVANEDQGTTKLIWSAISMRAGRSSRNSSRTTNSAGAS